MSGSCTNTTEKKSGLIYETTSFCPKVLIDHSSHRISLPLLISWWRGCAVTLDTACGLPGCHSLHVKGHTQTLTHPIIPAEGRSLPISSSISSRVCNGGCECVHTCATSKNEEDKNRLFIQICNLYCLETNLPSPVCNTHHTICILYLDVCVMCVACYMLHALMCVHRGFRLEHHSFG